MFTPIVIGSESRYEIKKSLRFRSANLAYLTRTPAAAGSQKTYTFSFWMKRADLGDKRTMFSNYVSGTNYFVIGFGVYSTGTDTLDVTWATGGSVVARKSANVVLRDPTSWMHLVVAVDTTNAVADDRIRIYINNTRIGSFSSSTNPSINYDLPYWNIADDLYIGAARPGAGTETYHFDGGMSEIHFVDGQSHTPSSFGEYDPATGNWIPKKYQGTYGTNGFYLPFDNGTDLTTLVQDRSGNGNDWTASGISLTSDITYDWIDDTPTNNFAVLNSVGSSVNSASVINGGLDYYAAGNAVARSSFQIPESGLWYAEMTSSSATSGSSVGMSFGVCKSTADINNAYNTTGLYVFYASNAGYLMNNGAVAAGPMTGVLPTETYRIAVDGGTGKIWLGRDSVWIDSAGGTTGDPATGSNPTFTVTGGDLHFCCGQWSTVYSTWSANFGQRPFSFAPPTGFKPLCSNNIPDPLIINPVKHFDIALDVGNGATNTITGIQFPPGLVWRKGRNAATYNNHALYDIVRGAAKVLQSNSGAVEVNVSASLTAFNTDGFSLGAFEDSNTSTNPYVSWTWKAGGAPVTNTDGSITSQVSANPTAGFSIVTYTGTGAAATVGHGLGAAPKMVIVKARNSIQDWPVYHASVGNDKALYLNLTNAQSSSSATIWNNTSTTSSLFSLGTIGALNGSLTNYVAYCFAEVPGYSKIGSYTGNGSAEGPFVYCGFRPRYIMIKRADSTSDWAILDSQRNGTGRVGFNTVNGELDANKNTAEVFASWFVDFLANGFKYRSASGLNVSGGTYVFMAIAETPFKYSNAR